MNKLIPALLLAVVSSFAQTSPGNIQFSNSVAAFKFPDTTYAELPAANINSGNVFRVIDASSSTCTAGGGVTKCHVVSNGSTWVLFTGGGGGGSGDLVGPASATDNAVARFDTATGKLLQNSGVTIDDSGNISTAGSITTGSGGSNAGYFRLGQGATASTGTNAVTIQAPASVTSYLLTLPSTAATGFLYGTNSGGNVALSLITNGTRTIASGTAAMTTSAIAAGTCGSTVTVAASGVVSTDVISFNPNASIKAVTGYTASGGLNIRQWPTTNNVNFELCNGSTASITPGAVTLNWTVQR